MEAPVKVRASNQRSRSVLASTVGAVLVLALLGAVVLPWLTGKWLVDDLRSWAKAHGATVHLTSWQRCLVGRLPARLRIDLPGSMNLDVSALHLTIELPFKLRLVANEVRLSLRGSPEQVWEEWLKLDAGREIPIEVKKLTIEYVDPTIGHVLLRDLETEARGQEYRWVAGQLEFERHSWNDVALKIARPKTVVTVQLDEADKSVRPIEFRYVPSSGRAAEWFIDIPSRSFRSTLERLQATNAGAALQTRMSGAITIAIPDDTTKPKFAVGQFVFDDWFVPQWPDAKALTGSSGAIGVRGQPLDGTPVWNLGRVEVAAGIFNLVGKGKFEVLETAHLNIEAHGRRTCAEFAAQARPSKYKDQVQAHLARSAQGANPKGTPKGNSETVELGFELSMTAGAQGSTTVSWHLTQGCGIDELKDVRTW